MPVIEHLFFENGVPGAVALSDFSIRALQLLAVLLLDKFITIPGAYHPRLLFQYIAQQLAKKVNQRSASHQRLAGLFSLLLLLTLALGLTWITVYFAASSWFYELVLLCLIISSKSKLAQARTIKCSLSQNHKILAREQLQLLCIRDTTSLSSTGIVKATIEALPQRLALSYYNPILIFACLGIYPTILVVTLSGLAQCWNPKLVQYRHFGSAAMTLNNIASFVTRCLLAINILVLFGTKKSSLNIIKQAKHWHDFGNGILLSSVAGGLNRSLGGAVIYRGIKIRRPKIGAHQQPTVENIDDIYRVCQQTSRSWIFLLLLALATSMAISNLI